MNEKQKAALYALLVALLEDVPDWCQFCGEAQESHGTDGRCRLCRNCKRPEDQHKGGRCPVDLPKGAVWV